jgi:hypothetical protein
MALEYAVSLFRNGHMRLPPTAASVPASDQAFFGIQRALYPYRCARAYVRMCGCTYVCTYMYVCMYVRMRAPAPHGRLGARV